VISDFNDFNGRWSIQLAAARFFVNQVSGDWRRQKEQAL